MKKLIIVLSLLCSIVCANTLEESYRIYPEDADKLYMSALSAINSSEDYRVIETQTKNGYILFLYGSRYYLATITRRFQNQSEIKIMPQNSDFSEGSVVARNVFFLINKQLDFKPMEPIQ